MTNLSKQIRDYFNLTNHWISYNILDNALDIHTPKLKTTRRVVIKNLVVKGILLSHPTMSGVYIKAPTKITWQ